MSDTEARKRLETRVIESATKMAKLRKEYFGTINTLAHTILDNPYKYDKKLDVLWHNTFYKTRKAMGIDVA